MAHIFRKQLIIAIALFLLSDSKVYEILSSIIGNIFPEHTHLHFWGIPFTRKDCAEGLIALVVLIAIIVVIQSGFNYLIKNFQSTRNIAHQIAEKIAQNAIRCFKEKQSIDEKDFDDLSTLAKELKSGQIKNLFLEECEKVVEYILNQPPSPVNTQIVNRMLDDVICQSVTYDGGQSNQENRRKVLQILNLVYGHILHPKNGNTPKTYDKTLVGYYFKKVGVAAMNHDDTDSSLEVIEQLYTIDADPKEIFSIGDQAFKTQNNKITIAAIHKLKSKSVNSIQQTGEITVKERRMIYNWLGLMARMYQKGGSTGEFASRHWADLLRLLEPYQINATDLTAEAYQHFFRLTDFDTADSVRYLEKNPPTA